MAFTNTRQPMQQAEFDTSFASQGAGTLNYKTLLIGQGTDAGTGSANVLTAVSDANDVAVKFGIGSILHRMALKNYANNSASQVTCIAASMDPVAVAANKAVGSIVFTGAATASGTLAVYIAGERILLDVTSGDTIANLADNLEAEITANHPNLPVTSTSDTIDTVDFEARCLGVTGDDIDIRTNDDLSETDPTGVTYTITAMNAGAADPALTTLIAGMGDEWFQVVASPYTDSTNFPAIQAEMERRFGPTKKNDGLVFTCKKETYANLVTFGSSNSTEQCSTMGIPSDTTGDLQSMTTSYEIAAAIAGVVAQQLQGGNGNEAKPFQTLILKGVDAPKQGALGDFIFSEKDGLLNNGIATYSVDANGNFAIQRLITMYQQTAGGTPDTAWLDSNTRFTAMFIRWDWLRIIALKYSQAKLADDGTRIGGGQIVMTPAIGKAEAVSAFEAWEVLGLVEDFEAFKSSVLAARDLTDVNKFNWQIFPDFVNQFRNGETTISIIL